MPVSSASASTPARDDSRALALIQRYGRTATAFRALGAGLEHWFLADEHGDRGLVAYRRTPGAMVSAGEPVAAPDDAIAVADAFVEFAASQRCRVSFFATEGILASSPRFRRVMVGEQPVWNPPSWDEHVSQHRSLREQLRRARAKGVTVQTLDAAAMLEPDRRASLEALIDRWFASRPMARMGFLVEVDPFAWLARRQSMVAMRGGTPVALLSMVPVPTRDGWLFEHLLRDPDAPNGTAELLIDHAMRELAADGVPWVTLGLAPLAGPVSGWLRSTRSWLRPLFNFGGLAAFKRKLRPQQWEPIYLAYPLGQSSGRAMLDSLRAFAGGSLWRFGLRTLRRGPAVLVHVLEWMLIPWTILLVLAPTSPWFPSRAVQGAWVMFDVLLLVALRALRAQESAAGTVAQRAATRRAAWRLSRALAIAVSADAVVTIAQAAWWNRSNTDSALGWAVVLIACLGPSLAAVTLWGATARMGTLGR
ncbi:phosphatidylglycerol lysyltransferase domain-containing protein [Gemmatimonas sp.]|uniref:phosphatidylglycerol lysyltransferase domain-containing protein n=1 Tax=Gemmatimonas sp. TaxID=1962908 RepID=UPI003565D9F0